MQVHDMIIDERRRAAEQFARLSAGQLEQRSLCQEWTVHEVAAHLATYLRFGQLKIYSCMVVGLGDFGPGNRWLARRFARHSTAELVEYLNRYAESTTTIPRSGYDPILTDLVLHDLDVRLPLGIERIIPEERLAVAFYHLTTVPSAGFAVGERLKTLRFEATDTGWSSGTGAPVRGPAEAVTMAMSGRAAALPALTGDGVGVLGRRIAEEKKIAMPKRLRKMAMTVLKPSDRRARDAEPPVLL